MAKILVTGSNRGIGLELCRQLRARGDEVIAICRESSPELDALDVRVRSGVDVTSDADVAALAGELEGETLDLLIHNAGLLTVESLPQPNLERIRKQIEVNALSPLRVTAALLPNLATGSKIAIVTSLMGSMADNSSGGYYGYRMSKAAVNMVGVTLARDLHERGIVVVLLHPGMVATRMTRGRGIPVADSVRGLIARCDALGLEESGSFWHAEGRPLPW